jgi:hypothetical protein
LLPTGQSTTAQQSQQQAQAQSSSTSFIPNYSEEPILEGIAQQAQGFAQPMANWASQNYASAMGNVDKLLNMSAEYASPQHISADMGSAEATATQAAESQRQAAEQNLASYGIDPSSGRYQELESAGRVQAAAAAAGLGNQQRIADFQTQQALLNQGIAAQQQAQQTATQQMQLPNQYLATAMQLKYPPLGTQSQMSSESSGESSGASQSTQSQAVPIGGGGGGGGGGGSQPYHDPFSSSKGGGGGGQPSGGGGGGYPTGGLGNQTGGGGGGGGTGGFTNPFGGGDGTSPTDTSGDPTGSPAGLPSFDPNNPGFDPNAFPADPGQGDTGESAPMMAWGGVVPYYQAGGDVGGITGGGATTGGASSAPASYGAQQPSSVNPLIGSGGQLGQSSAQAYGTGDASSPFGMARGGPISGGVVPPGLSPSNGARVDDVPARINQTGGTAHLNVDEFVVPRDVTLWKGQEFFQKLIEKSRQDKVGAPAHAQTARQ